MAKHTQLPLQNPSGKPLDYTLNESKDYIAGKKLAYKMLRRFDQKNTFANCDIEGEWRKAGLPQKNIVGLYLRHPMSADEQAGFGALLTHWIAFVTHCGQPANVYLKVFAYHSAEKAVAIWERRMTDSSAKDRRTLPVRRRKEVPRGN